MILLFASKQQADTLLAELEGNDALNGVSVYPVTYAEASDGRVACSHPFCESAITLFKEKNITVVEELPSDWVGGE